MSPLVTPPPIWYPGGGELTPPSGRVVCHLQPTGITGTQQAEIVEVDEWQLGGLPLEPAEIALIDLPDPEPGEGLDGLLGSDLLVGFGEVVVDYDGEQLRLAGE